MNELRYEQSSGTVPAFEFVTVNGAELRSPQDAYVHLWSALSPDHGTIGQVQSCKKRLQSFFSLSKKTATDQSRIYILLVDEIDHLSTPSQTIIYDIFDWSSLEEATKNKLIVVGISNTMNLKDRLHPRVQSRIGPNSILFEAYHKDSMSKILKAKIKEASPNYTVLALDAIDLAAASTARLSGDLRAAFRLCRSVTESVFREHESATTAPPVINAAKIHQYNAALSASPAVKYIGQCNRFSALLVAALIALQRSTGCSSGGFDVEETMTKMRSIANIVSNPSYRPSPDLMETLGLLERLQSLGILQLTTPRGSSLVYRIVPAGCGGPWPLISLRVEDDIALKALKQGRHNALARAINTSSNTA